MRIFVDENIPLMTVEALREVGHDVIDIRGTLDEGMADDALWERIQQAQRLPIPTDKGFASHRDLPHYGILIVRLRKPNRLKIHERVMMAMTQFRPEQWRGLLVVMRDTVQSAWRARSKR